MSGDADGRSRADDQEVMIERIESLLRASEARILADVRDVIAASERSTHQRVDFVFAQVEALLTLRDLVRLDHPLQPTRRSALSPDLLVEIVRLIETREPRVVVELGSGVSTVVMAACLRDRGSGTLLSIEHEERFAARTRTELARQGLSSQATVVVAPLGVATVRGEPWRWYTVPAEVVPRDIDLVLVDGPPGKTGPLARYPALPLLFDHLAYRTAIVLDDGARPDEREIVARWRREFRGFRARSGPFEKGAWILTRGD